MPRAAGKKPYYELGVVRQDGTILPDYTFKFDSVTSVLNTISKPALMHWYYRTGIEGISKLLTKYGPKTPTDFDSLLSLMKTEKLSPYAARDSAATKGTDIHSQLEELCKTGKIKLVTESNQGLLNWWDARGLSTADIIACEVPLVSFEHRVMGTADVIYRDPETQEIRMCDLKTGKYIGWTYFAQGEAYAMMAAEMTGATTFEFPPVDVVSVLQVRPEDEIEGGWKEVRAPEIGIETFLSALTIYRALPEKWNPEDIDG